MVDPLGPLDQVEPTERDNSAFTNCWEVTSCDRSDYLACHAYNQRKNCYELDRVLCCSKNRVHCSTCAVFIALNKTPTQKARVQVSTARMDIEGNVHIPMKMRFSDYMNREHPGFIALTEAKITLAAEPGRVIENDVAVVNKGHIIVAWPIEEAQSERPAA